MRPKEAVQWKRQVSALRSILASHDEIIASVSMMLLPDDIIMLIIEKLQIALQPQFLSALKVCIHSLMTDSRPVYISPKVAAARQNAVYAMASVMCAHKKASSWHLTALPDIVKTFSEKLSQLTLINNAKQSSVRQKERKRQLAQLRTIWNDSIV